LPPAQARGRLTSEAIGLAPGQPRPRGKSPTAIENRWPEVDADELRPLVELARGGSLRRMGRGRSRRLGDRPSSTAPWSRASLGRGGRPFPPGPWLCGSVWGRSPRHGRRVHDRRCSDMGRRSGAAHIVSFALMYRAMGPKSQGRRPSPAPRRTRDTSSTRTSPNQGSRHSPYSPALLVEALVEQGPSRGTRRPVLDSTGPGRRHGREAGAMRCLLTSRARLRLAQEPAR